MPASLVATVPIVVSAESGSSGCESPGCESPGLANETSSYTDHSISTSISGSPESWSFSQSA